MTDLPAEVDPNSWDPEEDNLPLVVACGAGESVFVPPPVSFGTSAGDSEVVEHRNDSHLPAATGRSAGWSGFLGWLSKEVVSVPAGHSLENEMLPTLLRNALPASGASLLYFAAQQILLMFVGHHLTPTEMAQYVVGISVFNVAGLSLALGFGGALDTLFSQAYGRLRVGEETQTAVEMGVIAQRGLLLATCLCFPIIIFFYAIGPLLSHFFGEIGAGAAVFLRYMPPYLLLVTLSSVFHKAFNAQGRTEMMMLAYLACVVVSFPLAYLLSPFGLPGCAAALSGSTVVLFAVSVALGFFHPVSLLHRGAKWPLDPLTLQRRPIKEHCKIGFASTVAVCAEWWAFEVLNLTVVRLGPIATDAFNIAYSITACMWAIGAAGTSTAAGVATGNAIGAGEPMLARAYARLSLVLVCCGWGVDIVLLAVFHRAIFFAYTSSPEVLQQLQGIVVWMCLHHIGDATQFVFQGICRGIGRQAQVARICLVGLWLVALPTSLLFSRVLGLGLHGVFSGFALGLLLVLVPVLFLYLRSIDWVAAVEESKSRAMRRPDNRDEFSMGDRPPNSTAIAHLATDTDAPSTQIRGVASAEFDEL